MALRITLGFMAALIAVAFCVSSNSADIKQDISKFDSVWKSNRKSNIEKRDAIKELPTGDKQLRKAYIKILESDVWQYRWQVTVRIVQETDEEFLKSMWSFVMDKAVKRSPAAGEHMIWALLRNHNFATLERWAELGNLIREKKFPEKVKARAIREMGIPRSNTTGNKTFSQDLAKQNVRLLIDLLGESIEDKRLLTKLQQFLIVDALESLSSKEYGAEVSKWNVWYSQEREDGKLKFRRREKFKDEFDNADLEGHSFVRETKRETNLEVLILPDLGKSDEYWYPYIFELNKTFKCSFIQLPDCTRMKNLKYMKDRANQVDKTAFDYPLRQLVDVFEERRQRSKQKKVGLIAHGVSGWVAMEYLRLHPDKIAFAIIMNTWSGQNSHEAGRNQMYSWKGKDPAYKWYAENLIYDPSGKVGSESLDKSQKMWASTGLFRRQAGDIRALEPIFYAVMKEYRVAQESSQRILVPDFEFAVKNKGKKIGTPVLFIHGRKDPMFIAKDGNDYKRTFTKMHWEIFENSGSTPWVDEPQAFFDAISSLMKKHKIIEEFKNDQAE